MRVIGLLVVCIVIGAGSVFLLGGDRVNQLTKKFEKEAPKEAPKVPTVPELINASERDFGKAEVELKKRWIDIYNAKAEAAKIEGDLKTEKDKLAHEEMILARTQQILEGTGPGDEIVIGGSAYAYHQVNGDALERVGSCEVLRRAITLKEQSLAKLQKACQDGKELIRRKVDELRREKIEFEAEKAELAALRAQQHLNDVIGKVHASGDVEVDLGEARQAFNKYLADRRGEAEFDQEIGNVHSGIVATWNKELGIEPDSAFTAVSRYFQKRDSTSKSSRSLEEALQNEQ